MYEHVEQRRDRVHEDPNERTHFEASHVHACHAVFGVCVVTGVGQARTSPSGIVVKEMLEGMDELLASSVPLWCHDARKNVYEQEVHFTIKIPSLYFSV